MQIVDPPTLTVTGLEGTGYTVEITGTKTDTVFGEPQDPVRIDTITLGPDNWRYVLSDRGEKLVPLDYNFEPQEIEGYTYTVNPPDSGGNYVIEYTLNTPDSLTPDPAQLVLPKGETGKLFIKEDNCDKSVYPKSNSSIKSVENTSISQCTNGSRFNPLTLRIEVKYYSELNRWHSSQFGGNATCLLYKSR